MTSTFTQSSSFSNFGDIHHHVGEVDVDDSSAQTSSSLMHVLVDTATKTIVQSALAALLVSSLNIPTAAAITSTTSSEETEARISHLHVSAMYTQPSFHIAAGAHGGWVNDPCGLLYHNGVYHVFYQYSTAPSGNSPRRWAHAISDNLHTWKRLPDALWPTPGGHDSVGAWSGAAGVDATTNTPYMLFTGAAPWSATQKGGPDYDEPRQTQLVAWPTDGTLGNWITDHKPLASDPPAGGSAEQFRDPCSPYAVKNASDNLQRTLVGAQVEGNRFGAVVYASKDIARDQWQARETFFIDTFTPAADNLECPDLFEVENGIWVFKWSVQSNLKSKEQDMWIAGTLRDNGDGFDPLPGTSPMPVDLGTVYASRTMAANDSRRLLWGWSRERDQASAEDRRAWQGSLTVPRELTWDATRRMLLSFPAQELLALRGEVLGKIDVPRPAPAARRGAAVATLLAPRGAGAADFEILASAPPAALRGLAVGIRLLANSQVIAEVWLGARGLHIFGNDVPSPVGGVVPRSGASNASGRRALRILVDGTMIEAFADGGVSACTARVYTKVPASEWKAEVCVRGSAGRLKATAWAMEHGV